MTTIKIGLVGSGFISQVAHIPNYDSNLNCELVALAELRQDLGSAVRSKWNIPRLYRDHNRLLEDGDIDAVVVVVRRHHTAPIALDVINSGKHLFTEKPFAQTWAIGNKLVEQSSKKNLVYGVGFMRRYDCAVKKAKDEFNKIIATNELGSLLFTRVYLSAGGDYCNIDGDIKSDEPKPLDPVWEIAPTFLPEALHRDFEHFVNVSGHDINLLRYFFPEEIVVKSAFYEPSKGSVVVFDLGNSYGTFEWMDTLQPTKWEEGIEFRFQKGFIKLTLQPAFLRNQPASLEIYRDDGRNGGHKLVYQPDWTWSFKNQSNAFIEALNKHEQPVSNAYDALNDLVLIEDIWRNIIK